MTLRCYNCRGGRLSLATPRDASFSGNAGVTLVLNISIALGKKIKGNATRLLLIIQMPAANDQYIYAAS